MHSARSGAERAPEFPINQQRKREPVRVPASLLEQAGNSDNLYMFHDSTLINAQFKARSLCFEREIGNPTPPIAKNAMDGARYCFFQPVPLWR